MKQKPITRPQEVSLAIEATINEETTKRIWITKQTIIMECPKDRGVCWPYETNDFEQLKSLLLEQYTKEELWAMLEKIRAKKATLEKNTFNNIRKGE